MPLSCEIAGLGPNGPLTINEQAVYTKFAHRSPKTYSPMRYVTETVFATQFGPRNLSELPPPTTPMDTSSDPDENGDIEMRDAPPERRVTFTPPPDYSRPTSSSFTAMPPRTALSQRIHLINKTETYVPQEPYPLDEEVDYSQPELHGFPTTINAGSTPKRTTNTFAVPDDSYSELSPEITSPPPRVLPKDNQWRIAPNRTSPQGRKTLSPVSPKIARSPPQSRVLSPEALYPSLQAANRKRARPGDIPERPEERPNTSGWVVGLIRAVTTTLATKIWSFLRPRRTIEQEIIGVHTSAYKRRAVARQDIEAAPVPGYYPGSEKSLRSMISTSPAKVPDATAMATPPDSRSGSEEKETPPREQVTVQQHSPPQRQTTAPKSSLSQPTELSQDAREQITDTQPSPPQIQAEPKRSVSGTQPWKRTAFRTHYAHSQPTRAQRNQDADDRVDELTRRAKDIQIMSPEEEKLRNSIRTRKSRIREINEQVERERQAEEEAKLLAERERKEKLKRAEEERKQAEREAEIAAEKEAARQAAKKTLLPEMSPEWHQRIIDTMSTRDPAKVLGTDSRGSELTRKTLGCILPQENEHLVKDNGDLSAKRGPAGWLNDEGVDGFIGSIVDRRRAQDGYVKGQGSPAFANFACQWYNTVKKNGIKAIARWSRRQQISNEKLLGCEKIFFPVNTGAHWVLLILSPKDRTMEFLDSAGGSGRTFFKLAREWLNMELGAKYIEDEWEELDSKSEGQRNMDDCGIFTCMNALASAKGADYTAVNPVRNMPKARLFITQVLLNGGFSEEFDL